MNAGKTLWFLGVLTAVSCLLPMPAVAGAITGDPTFLPPNATTNSPVTFMSQRPVANGYALTTYYFDIDGNQVRQETGPVYSATPASLSWGTPNSNADVYADAGAFEAKAYHEATTDGSRNQYSYGSAQVWNWYVLNGNPGDEVTLSADILLQGRAYADNDAGGNAGTIFGLSLGFLSSPDDLTQDRVISVSGAVNWSAGFSTNNTIDENLLWEISDATHEMNYVIRSQPFTATVGVPFRLSLVSSAQGFAGPGAWGNAWSDFFDPRLVTSADFAALPQLTADGFAVVVGDGEYSTLDAQGYSLTAVPEPSAVILFIAGLVGAWGLRKKLLG
jgi:hypothetical protein